MALGGFFSSLLKDTDLKGAEKAISTKDLAVNFKDANGRFFRGRFIRVFEFNGLVRYQYEVNDGILLLDKPAEEVNLSVYKGFSEPSRNYQTTYNSSQKLQRQVFASHISSRN